MPYPKGCCRDCGGAPQPGASRCKPCAGVAAEREAARRAAALAAGRCVVCGKRAARVAGEPLTTCPDHREYYRRREEIRRKARARAKARRAAG